MDRSRSVEGSKIRPPGVLARPVQPYRASRRHWLRRFAVWSAGIAGVSLAGTRAQATAAEVDALIAAYTDGSVPSAQEFGLLLPEIAENGASVPVTIDIDSPMSAVDHVVSVKLFAPRNPHPLVVTLSFSPASGLARASTRMRLAQSQSVIAIAMLSGGRTLRAERAVKVTLGGCGG